MVLLLSVPGLSRANPAPIRSNEANVPHRTSSRSTPGKHLWKPSGILTSSPDSPSTTLSEALRNNPFGIPTRSRTVDASDHDRQERQREQDELNNGLEVLAQLFPDVKTEVFRELLVRFDGESRLQVCVDQLLRYKKEWVAGRWNVPDGKSVEERVPPEIAGENNLVPREERFRSREYKTAAKSVLAREFNGLGKSTVDAVLAEVNFCYARARPTLRDLSRRTWRATFNSMFPSFRRKKDKDEHPLMLWQRAPDGELVPRLKETGCCELDQELYDILLAPLLLERREVQEGRDFALAEELNEAEAREADALYECECCLMDATFEQIATCSVSSHVICYSCIQRTVQEALFGQGWAKSVDMEKATLKCLAPMTYRNCEGCLHPDIVKQAILVDKGGAETYRTFEDRLASDALLKSQLKLIRCPFCSYAEADPVYHPSSRGISWRFRRDGVVQTILTVFFLLDLIPLFAIPALILLLLDPDALRAILNTSLLNLCLKVRAKRFTCSNPSCHRTSCVTCQKPWRDPHACDEPLLLDLRATVEAARTAAVKRTCPRCGLAFVKSSGCNKLTCVCGYSMCYLCRKALGPPPLNHPLTPRPRPRGNPRRVAFFNQENINIMDVRLLNVDEDQELEDENENDEPESYSHFCEHFRINPGSRCTECTKCDLYQSEDEEAVARRAGEKAEREWRARQGVAITTVGSAGPGFDIARKNINHDFSAETTRLCDYYRETLRYWFGDVWREGRWRVEGQRIIDGVVERVVDVVEI